MGCNIKKTIVIFIVNIPEFVEMQSFIKNQKTLHLVIKIPYLHTFRLEFEKTVVFEISIFKFVKMPSFVHKKTLWVLGLKCLFWYFYAKKLLSYLKSFNMESFMLKKRN